MKPQVYISFAALALVCLLWLHNCKVPDLVVATVEDPHKIVNAKGEEETEIARKGKIFVNVTTLRANKPLSMIGYPIQVVAYARGWDALLKWWPFALACALGSSMVGWMLGKETAHDIYKEDADRRIKNHDYKLTEAESKLHMAEEKIRKAATALQQAEQIRRWAQEAERAAGDLVEKADARTAEEKRAREEAERKLAKEREENQKTVAQLLKYKEKAKMNKGIDKN